ncbi:hypothetical protein GPA10_22495 [Streptomyces sp. p1417]|uniref:Uncharacterized protein n=1 Tax=Streptomyces typhae TaxID=2681492 RepID=A0A6L6X166_9ACTN|nr:hypothetical protein [Streptomyces typhae]MVO87456.1 hypothetical protein [Streptomyces typhae]
MRASSRPRTWVEQALSDELFERDEVAWVEWQIGGNLFGPERPHKYFSVI